MVKNDDGGKVAAFEKSTKKKGEKDFLNGFDARTG